MEMFEQWLGAIIDIVTDEHIAESVVDGRTLIDEAALAEQKLCIFLAEDESVDVEILQSLGLEARSSMLTEQAKKDRAGYTAPREMPTIMRRQRPALSAGGSHGGGPGNGMALLGILDDGSGYDDDTGPSPRGGGTRFASTTHRSVMQSTLPTVHFRTHSPASNIINMSGAPFGCSVERARAVATKILGC